MTYLLQFANMRHVFIHDITKVEFPHENIICLRDKLGIAHRYNMNDIIEMRVLYL